MEIILFFSFFFVRSFRDRSVSPATTFTRASDTINLNRHCAMESQTQNRKRHSVAAAAIVKNCWCQPKILKLKVSMTTRCNLQKSPMSAEASSITMMVKIMMTSMTMTMMMTLTRRHVSLPTLEAVFTRHPNEHDQLPILVLFQILTTQQEKLNCEFFSPTRTKK